jgi:hypothetical protein
MESTPFNGRLLGAILTAVGISIIKLATNNFVSRMNFSLMKLLSLFVKLNFTVFGLITTLIGCLLTFSKAGIIEENY